MRPDAPYRPRFVGDVDLAAVQALRRRCRTVHGALLAGDQYATVELVTDSPRIAETFAANTLRPDTGLPRPAVVLTLFALAGDWDTYSVDGLGADELAFSQSGHAALANCRSYIAVKVAIRGLVSLFSPEHIGWFHGCAMSLSGPSFDSKLGVLLVGASGAGKTTTVAGLRRYMQQRAGNVRIVNDDWGAVDMRKGLAHAAGEPELHMKVSSIQTLRPDLVIDQIARRAEPRVSVTAGDPVQRVLASPFDVFGTDGVALQTRIDHVVLMTRQAHGRSGIERIMDTAAMQDALVGEYSAYYDRVEDLFDGSLITTADRPRSFYVSRYEELARSAVVWHLRNDGPPESTTSALISALFHGEASRA